MLDISDAELTERRSAEGARSKDAFIPVDSDRQVSLALRAYAPMGTSADNGAVRKLD